MTLYTRLAIPMFVLSLMLGACTTTAQVAGNIGQSLSTATPQQARTLAEAFQAATLVTNTVDAYIQLGNPNRATLEELQVLNERVHSILANLQAANSAGQSLTFAVFNEALNAFSAYSTAKGINH